MTELEKIEVRIQSIDTAISAVKAAQVMDRKMSSDRHPNGRYTKALTELIDIQSQLHGLRKRVEIVGR